MSRFLDDQAETTPGQVRLHVCGIALPSTFGLTSAGMTTYLCFFPDDDENSIAVGFILAAIFLGFAQLRTRGALQTKDRGKRISRLTGLRNLHAFAIGFAVAGFVIAGTVVLLPPHQGGSFRFLTQLSLWFACLGLVLTPFAFRARRIPWLAEPR